MGMEGFSGAAQVEADPLSHLLEESGIENTSENRAEAEQVKAMFEMARKQDADISPEAKEQLEGDVSAKQEVVLDRTAAVAAKAAEFERRNTDDARKKELDAQVEEARGKVSLYNKLTMSSFAGIAAGILVPMGIAGMDAVLGHHGVSEALVGNISQAAGLAWLTSGLVSMVGASVFSDKLTSWRNKLHNAKAFTGQNNN